MNLRRVARWRNDARWPAFPACNHQRATMPDQVKGPHLRPAGVSRPGLDGAPDHLGEAGFTNHDGD